MHRKSWWSIFHGNVVALISYLPGAMPWHSALKLETLQQGLSPQSTVMSKDKLQPQQMTYFNIVGVEGTVSLFFPLAGDRSGWCKSSFFGDPSVSFSLLLELQRRAVRANHRPPRSKQKITCSSHHPTQHPNTQWVKICQMSLTSPRAQAQTI